MSQKEAPYNGPIILIYFKGNHFQWTVYKRITFLAINLKLKWYIKN